MKQSAKGGRLRLWPFSTIHKLHFELNWINDKIIKKKEKLSKIINKIINKINLSTIFLFLFVFELVWFVFELELTSLGFGLLKIEYPTEIKLIRFEYNPNNIAWVAAFPRLMFVSKMCNVES